MTPPTTEERQTMKTKTNDERRAAIEAAMATKGTKVPMGTSGIPAGETEIPVGGPAQAPKGKSRTPRAPRLDWAALTPAGFFRPDGRAFLSGHDARLTGMLRRMSRGEATPAEVQLADALRTHPKVAQSRHFMPLVAAAFPGGTAKPQTAPKGK